MILYFTAADSAEEAFFRGMLPGHDLRFVTELAEVDSDAEGICIFIYSQITDDFLAAHPFLQLVVTRSGGLDHIDIGACRARNVIVSNVPQYGETTVAEHTFALILALSRRLRQAMELPQRGEFAYQDARGFDLAGKTLGVIGQGRIGQRVTKFGRCFGMRVLAFDPVMMSPEFASEHDFQWVPLETLLRESHVVTLHVKLSPTTRHMLNRETIGLCRHGALIVNTARGGLIDTMALEEALDDGRIGGAGLDVLEDERVLRREATEIISAEIVEHLHSDIRPEELRNPRRVRDFEELITGHSLLARSNVVFTPHVAFNSVEAVERLNLITAENIRAYAAGCPQNAIL